MSDFRLADDDATPKPPPRPSFLDAEEEAEKQKPQPAAPQAPAAASAGDDPTADDVFAGMSARLRARPHIPPPQTPGPTATPAQPAAPNRPAPPAQPRPAAPRPAQPQAAQPAIPPLPIPPRPAPPARAGEPAIPPLPIPPRPTPGAPAVPGASTPPGVAPAQQPPVPQRPAAQAAPAVPEPRVAAPGAKSAAPRTPAVPKAPDPSRTPAAPRTPSVPRTPSISAADTPAPPPGHPGVPAPRMSAGGPPPQPQAPPEPRLHVEFAHSQNSAADWTDEITQFAPAASTAVNIGAVIAFLAAAFLVFEIASGRTKVPTEAGNFSSAAAVFCLSALVTGAGLIVSQWRTRATGFMLAVFGMVLLAGVPSFLPKTVQSSAALFQGSGFFIFILGLAKIGIDVAFGVSPKSTTTHAAGTYQAASPAPPPGMHRAPVAPQQHASPIQGQHAPPAPGASHVPHPSVPQPKVPVEEEIIDDGNQFSTLRHTMESMEPVALWVFRIAAAVGGLALGYLLYAIFAGHIGQADATISSGTVSMVKLAATVLQWSLILLALSGLWLAMDMPYLGLMLIGVGMATYFGAPWALGTVGKTQILADVATSLRSCGFGLSIVGIIKQLYETVLWAMNLPNRMKQKADVGTAKMAEPAQRKVAREATMTSPCWKLPFCREAIRKQCPAFLAKKTCWKFGRGCYCDEEMISRIIRGESTDVVKAPTRLSRKGKPPCGRCHIYMEHQGYKFKMLSPLAIPGSALLMYAIWPHYSALLAWVLTRPFWDAINFGSIKAKAPLAPNDPSNVPVSSLSDDQIAYFATIFLGILLGFFIFVQVSKFIEWAIYKAKL